MSGPGIVGIRIRRGETVFHVYGEHQGIEGVWLGQGQVEGIYDAPVQVTDKTGAFQIGSTRKGHKWLHRDMELGFHVIETATEEAIGSFEWNESVFRQIFDYRLDPWATDPKPTVVEVETELSGVRKINVLMYEQPDFASDVDPLLQQYGNIIMKLRANEPMWYEDDVVEEFTSDATSASGFIEVSNPTDQVMYHKWVLTPATWTIPDRQWIGDPGERTTGGDQGNRFVEGVVITAANGGAVGDLDRAELMWRDLNNTNLLGQLGGAKILNFPIPPYTPLTLLPISFEASPYGGATAQLIQPRRWSRPYGLEPVTIVGASVDSDVTTRFSVAGSYSYTIPEWADAVDVVLVGGGGGAGGGLPLLLLRGYGGAAGAFATTTLVRGVDIPITTTTIAGVVGAGGGAGDRGSRTNGHDGQATTAVGAGMTTINAAGGDGSGSVGPHGYPRDRGEGTGDTTLNGIVYKGSTDEYGLGNPGNAPGGGGSGGLNGHGDGARGQVWFRAYKVQSQVVQPDGATLTLTGALAHINIVMVVPTGATLTLTPGTPDVRVE